LGKDDKFEKGIQRRDVGIGYFTRDARSMIWIGNRTTTPGDYKGRESTRIWRNRGDRAETRLRVQTWTFPLSTPQDINDTSHR
jgi:hypothetical protein